MAEVLIALQSTSHPDPAIDRRGCWKAGMPVAVAPDGHEWGAREGLPRFFVVRLPGIEVDQIRGYVQEEYDPEDYQPTSNRVTGEARVIRRREWQVMLDEVSGPMRDLILATGSITIGPPEAGGHATWDQMRVRLWSHRLELFERRSAPRS